MSEPDAIFEPVSPDEASDPEDPTGGQASSPASRAPSEARGGDGGVQRARADPFPLAGPILENARSEILRGRCSSCESRLRVRLEAPQEGSIRVRCPICGHTRRVDLGRRARDR